MPLDTSIYQNVGNFKQIEQPDLGSAMAKGMTLSNLARQGQAQDQEMQAKAKTQRISAWGNALDGLASVKPEQRDSAYAQMRSQLISDGFAKPDELPEQRDDGLLGNMYSRWKQTPESLEKQKALAGIDHLKAQTAKDRAEAGAKGQGFELGSNLRKEWTGLPTTKATQEVSSAYNKIQNAAADPSAAGDLSLLYGFNKLLDPGSAVKEQEFANAAAAGSVDSRIRGQWQKVVSGQRLSPEQRADFIKQSNALYSAQLEAQNTVDGQYTALAQRYGVDPKVVMMKFPNPKELKVALKQEESKPGFFEGLFGGKTAQASTPKTQDFNAMNDDDLFKAWSARQGGQ